ncbi:Lrp/AsnC family transcriptional regulator [Candidatus Woesearchaeota archaeon]|jgi:DNA-binding Lrp family transcriptional regulator|nr:Lrp/AsnC family transcriptional regulator [Candidatus Woesearchaeota archaeon]
MVVILDAKDKKILSELDMDARQPVSAIAKKVGLSKEVVNYRIKQLEKKKVITGYYTVLNVTKLGLMFCRLFTRFQNVDLAKEKEIVAFAGKHPQICWVVSTKGPWDMVFVVLVNKISDFKRISDNFSFKYSTYFQNRFVSIATKIRHMKHNYLYGTKDDREAVLGGDDGDVDIDETDYKILSILARDARISTLEIARRLDITPNTVKYRIKKMLDSGVILCFRAGIGIKKIGYQRHKVILTLQNMTEAKMMKMIEFLRQNPNIVYITEAIGGGDMELEIDVKGSNELHENMTRIRSEFGELIKDYEICMTYSEEQINYLPCGTVGLENIKT